MRIEIEYNNIIGHGITANVSRIVITPIGIQITTHDPHDRIRDLDFRQVNCAVVIDEEDRTR